MPSALTAIIEDTLLGRRAAGLRLQVYWVEPQGDVLLKAASTNDDGTTALPLISGAKLSAGVYKIVLHAGDYFQHAHPERARALDIVPVVFVIDDAAAGRQVRVELAPDRYSVHCALHGG
ncbi:MAG TPA: hydroxyisourate hydrolase [Tepidisphaeraceae bacterium]